MNNDLEKLYEQVLLEWGSTRYSEKLKDLLERYNLPTPEGFENFLLYPLYWHEYKQVWYEHKLNDFVLEFQDRNTPSIRYFNFKNNQGLMYRWINGKWDNSKLN